MAAADPVNFHSSLQSFRRIRYKPQANGTATTENFTKSAADINAAVTPHRFSQYAKTASPPTVNATASQSTRHVIIQLRMLLKVKNAHANRMLTGNDPPNFRMTAAITIAIVMAQITETRRGAKKLIPNH